MPSLHQNLAQAIVKHQESIVGPLAWSEAGKVSGISIHDHSLSITGDGKQVLEKLVRQYETLFGQASIEACKEAVKAVLPKDQEPQVPPILL